jgi:hypothetical protein
MRVYGFVFTGLVLAAYVPGVANACINCDMPAGDCGAKVQVCQSNPPGTTTVTIVCANGWTSTGPIPSNFNNPAWSDCGAGGGCNTSTVFPCAGADWGSVDSCDELCFGAPH